MADNESPTASRCRCRREIKEGREVDSISSLPDVILQHILSFVLTKVAITTSVLSKRWRHVWCDTPSLFFNGRTLMLASLYKTQTRYTAPKMMTLYLQARDMRNIPNINMWLELAMSRNVEILFLRFHYNDSNYNYSFPDSFYVNSSVKQLIVDLSFTATIPLPTCSVSWTSMKNLTFRCRILSDESIAKILSGCPILESLTLVIDHCNELKVLDLTKSPRLKTLYLTRNFRKMQIVAPHIHGLTMINSHLPCTLVDVSSLDEAKLRVFLEFALPLSPQRFVLEDAPILQHMALNILEMLKKLQNVEKLTFEGYFLQILSLAELGGDSFPMFKVKDMTLETPLFQYVIPPGIEKLLRNSPGLKKLTVRIRTSNTKMGEDFDNYFDLLGSKTDQWSRSKDGVHWEKSSWSVETKHVASFMELMLKNTKTLEKMVVKLEDRYFEARGFKEMVHTFSQNNNNNVSIVFSTKPTMTLTR